MAENDDAIDRDLMLSRFQRLIGELIRGVSTRTVFEPWELQILLDVNECALNPKQRTNILRQYQNGVAKQLEKGPGPPMKLSEFLQRRKTRRASME
jgi:hypothetical protein